jgi:hypothetical protein
MGRAAISCGEHPSCRSVPMPKYFLFLSMVGAGMALMLPLAALAG